METSTEKKVNSLDLQSSLILVYIREYEVRNISNPSHLTKGCLGSFTCDEQDIPNCQENKNRVLEKHADCSIFSLFLQPAIYKTSACK